MPIYILLIDLRKAFDSVSHQALFKRLREIKLPSWFIQYLLNFYQSATVTIKCADGETESIPINCGVLQGDPLSPLLFNIVFDIALRDLGSAVRAFADDLALTATSLRNLQTAANEFQEGISTHGHPTHMVPRYILESG